MEPDGARTVAPRIRELIAAKMNTYCDEVTMKVWRLSDSRKRWREILTWILFYSGAVRVLHRLANRLRLNRNDTGEVVFPFIRQRRSRDIQILTYHRVNDERDPYFCGVPVEIFRQQMEYVSSVAYVCSLEEAVERIKKSDIPDNTVVITFDDGYRDNFENAFPILRALSIPATFFLATSAIGSRITLWHDLVFSAFRETQESWLADYGPQHQNYSLGTVREKLAAQTDILKFLKSLSPEEKHLWIVRLREKLGVREREEMSELMLTWEQVSTMHQNGMYFGSHTITHPILSRLPVEQMKEEIRASRVAIEEHLGIPIRTFAYPNGTTADFNEVTKKLLQEDGYTCAVSTIFGVNTSAQDLFELRRGGPSDWHLPTFATKLHWYKLDANT